MYLTLATLGSIALALSTGFWFDRLTAVAGAVAVVVDASWTVYGQMGRSFLLRGRLPLIGAGCCFLAAVTLSLIKQIATHRSAVAHSGEANAQP